MPRATGNRLPSAALNPAAFQLQCNATATLGAAANLSLANVTPGYVGNSITVPEGGMVGLAIWTVDFQLTAAGGTVTSATVDILIDGVVPTDAPEAVWDPGNVTDGRVTAVGHWPLNLTAGVHTFGLRGAAVLVAPSVVKANAKHTNLSIWLHP